MSEESSEPTLTAAPARAVVGDGVVLRPWTLNDAALLVTLADDPLLAKWNPTAAQSDIASAHEWIAKQNEWSDFATWAIHDADTNEIVGGVSLFHLDGKQLSGELGYWVLPHKRGRSYAARALLAAARFGYSELGLVRAQLFHAVENEQSCRVATKAGFIVEGTLRKSYRYPDGQLHDEHLHARLCTD